jgi:hypothetical protein
MPPEHMLFLTGYFCDLFGFVYEGLIDIQTAGNYTWDIGSDDGSLLWLDGNLLIDNDGLQGETHVQGTRWLEPGEHHVRMAMFENRGGALFNAKYQLKGQAWKSGAAIPMYHQSPSGVGATYVHINPSPLYEYELFELKAMNVNATGFDFSVDLRVSDANAVTSGFAPDVCKGKNVAKFKSVSVPGGYGWGSIPSRATDGNINNGNYNGEYCLQTNDRSNNMKEPTITIDLGGMYRIAYVVLYGRRDCCMSQRYLSIPSLVSCLSCFLLFCL